MFDTREKNFISVVVYVYNAEKTVGAFLHTLYGYLRENFLDYEIICVNDSSTDKSRLLIEGFAKDLGCGVMSILDMGYFQGLELSMNAGVDLAIGDFVYEFDSTVLSYPDMVIRDVYDRCLSGYDIVSASPRKYGGGCRSFSNIFYSIYNRASGSQYRLQTEAFRILSRRAINRVRSISRTLPYRKAVYANCGLRVDRLPYEQTSKIPSVGIKERRHQRDTAINALILYTDIAYRSSFFFSVLMIVLMALTVVYTCCIFVTGQPVQGWTTTMLVLSFGFFGLSFLMTILIKYASLILQTVFVRQDYVIGSIDKLG